MDAARLPDYSATGTQSDQDHKTANNYAYRPYYVDPSVAHPLVVFLPGEGDDGTDEKTQFYQYAASQGYFVVGLDYIRDAGPVALCTCNDSCYGDVFEQLVDIGGVDNGFFQLYFGAGTPQAGQIGYNSVERRLTLMLLHMQSIDPTYATQWGSYL